jgi:hypothetical protein
MIQAIRTDEILDPPDILFGLNPKEFIVLQRIENKEIAYLYHTMLEKASIDIIERPQLIYNTEKTNIMRIDYVLIVGTDDFGRGAELVLKFDQALAKEGLLPK